MMTGPISRRVVADRLDWIERMLTAIRSLPLSSQEAFFADSRNVWAAEPCLRRALEALFDLGRHILAKGYALGVSEYKEIVKALEENQVINAEVGEQMRILAGYRNRMVHFYHEVSAEELYEICSTQLGEVEAVADALRRWLNAHEDRLDCAL